MSQSPEFEKQQALRRRFVEEFGHDPSEEEVRLLGLSLQCEPMGQDEHLSDARDKAA